MTMDELNPAPVAGKHRQRRSHQELHQDAARAVDITR